MSIGYACLTIGVPFTDFKSCIMKNANESRLLVLISHNLNSLENIIDYNIKNNILLFRISSSLIPFGSSPVNNLPWWEIFSADFQRIGDKIRQSDMRVSMHPGQYTVLNSPNDDIVSRAVDDLNYHVRVLDSLCVDSKHKIVLHIGGVYNDKPKSMSRFIENYLKLNDSIKSRLVIENDDKSYTINEVLNIGKQIDIPVIFDNLHNKINPSLNKNNQDTYLKTKQRDKQVNDVIKEKHYDKHNEKYNEIDNEIQKDEFYWIEECRKTWSMKDGIQKIHYSQQHPLKSPGSHSDSIDTKEFIDFYNKLNRDDIDIMLEVKDKNLSAMKCMNIINESRSKN